MAGSKYVVPKNRKSPKAVPVTVKPTVQPTAPKIKVVRGKKK